MSNTLIVARIRPNAEADVARIFAASDASELPEVIGVRERSLYSLGDVYIHVLESGDDELSLHQARSLPGFQQISRDLAPFIRPYLPGWRGPQDAVAKRFYHWRASE